jgi:hypothetical protein
MRNSINKNIKLTTQVGGCLSLLVLSGSLLLGGVANAASLSTKSTAQASAANTPSSSASTTTGSSTSATSPKSGTGQKSVQVIISKGDQEIARRQATLNTLTTKINGATHISASDKAMLSSEVSSTASGLATLKTQLDSDTTITSAHTDAENIYTEYRVYAVVAPKVTLIKVADDQQTVEAKLVALITKLQTRINADQKANDNVSSMQALLADMQKNVPAAQTISSHIESSVIGLVPSDYNSNHSVLSGDNTQLKTAHTDNKTSVTDAKTIAADLKSTKS